ncbi:chromate transporter [Paenibacillus validus]|uniref:Chromate transporter n=1 Tax=Paenibacillus chartarius TaxID=747481 RepID=A0ABV6DLL5_9BACL|nr:MULTISPECIES: chromate transporter [Paenibacillaceae]MED4600078.1 chromate transporter [Paenibacillus validus]MED4605655.1 chromate transporter [Paenibacillus validus]NTZ20682.1 chromate transporter [Paenibacillus sp. JMULE4]
MEKNDVAVQNEPKSKPRALLEVLAVSTKLGLTSFGGPIAHLGYFHDEYIRRRKWMDERSYADLVALCQFLPGPASSQVGIGIGVIRAGLLGGLTAWLGFTLPSVIALVLFAFLLQGFDIESAGWIHGLKIVAVAIVAQAVLGMGQKLTPDRNRATIAIIAASATLLWQTAFSQFLLIVVAGIAGLMLYRKTAIPEAPNLSVPISRSFAVICLSLFFGLLIALPLLRQFGVADWLSLFDSFYRAGSLVFGGGHVVLPLLEREVVPTGWISEADFLAGYGAAQAVPGPLFTFAGYLGAMINGVKGAMIATAAIFLPAFLLIIGALPFWNSLRKSPKVQGALIGINAAVVGILLAALYNPLWTTAILAPADFALVSTLFLMLVFWKIPPWVVVIIGAIGGTLLGLI